jgi:hypothetical protein
VIVVLVGHLSRAPVAEVVALEDGRLEEAQRRYTVAKPIFASIAEARSYTVSTSG